MVVCKCIRNAVGQTSGAVCSRLDTGLPVLFVVLIGCSRSVLPGVCETMPAREGQAPWHVRPDPNCVTAETENGAIVKVTPERVTWLGQDGNTRWQRQLAGCAGVRGVAIAPDQVVAVSCTHSFYILDSRSFRRDEYPGALFYSAPLVTDRLVVVAHGPWLEAYTFSGQKAWQLCLTEAHPSPHIPALARDEAGNILVSLYLGGELDLGRGITGDVTLLNRYQWAPHLLTVSRDGQLMKRVRTNTANFPWPNTTE